jgi:hypothetical protein
MRKYVWKMIVRSMGQPFIFIFILFYFLALFVSLSPTFQFHEILSLPSPVTLFVPMHYLIHVSYFCRNTLKFWFLFFLKNIF